jgi:hypothetical protein
MSWSIRSERSSRIIFTAAGLSFLKGDGLSSSGSKTEGAFFANAGTYGAATIVRSIGLFAIGSPSVRAKGEGDHVHFAVCAGAAIVAGR